MPTAKPSAPAIRALLDSVVREIAPVWHLRRQSARMRAERNEQIAEVLREHRERRRGRSSDGLRNFDAASPSPRTAAWKRPLTSPDAALGTYLDRLRNGSRDLVRNNPWAHKATRAIPVHMVGTGLRATFAHRNAAVAKRAQELWNRWAGSRACDADGRTNFAGLQRLVVREVVEAGEVLARMRLRRTTDGLEVPLQVQTLEAEFLDSTRDNATGFSLAASSGNLLRQGVEFDARGKRVGYWLYPVHPAFGVGHGSSKFIPADGVAHVYRSDRSGQVRGIPWGAAVLLAIRDLGDWQDASILRAKLAACFAAFITTNGDIDDADAAGATATGRDLEEIEPGMIEYLREGQTVEFANPPGVEGMESFATTILQAIAVGYNLPFHVLTGDLRKVNFSSSRIGNLDFAGAMQADRDDWLVPQFCDPVAAAFLAQAERAQGLPPGCTVTWSPPPEPLVEPKVDLEASKMRIRFGLSTLSEEQRRYGWEPRELLEEQAADWEAVDALGLTFESDPRVAAAGSPGGTPPKEDGDEKPAEGDEETPPKDPEQDPEEGDAAGEEAGGDDEGDG